MPVTVVFNVQERGIGRAAIRANLAFPKAEARDTFVASEIVDRAFAQCETLRGRRANYSIEVPVKSKKEKRRWGRAPDPEQLCAHSQADRSVGHRPIGGRRTNGARA